MVPLLQADKIYKSYHDGERELKVLRGASFTVERGEAVAVVGMSGSGKSTLLHLLGGLDIPDQGTIEFEGEPLGRSIGKLHHFRNHKVGFVFQFHHLLPEFSALENIMMPALIGGRPRAAIAAQALATLEKLGLGERAKHRPSKLSGGEQQRVALARALVNEPSLLLADEPTGNLDVHTGGKVIEMMWGMTVRQNRGLVIVTHEHSIAARADRVLRLTEGRLEPIARQELETFMAKR